MASAREKHRAAQTAYLYCFFISPFFTKQGRAVQQVSACVFSVWSTWQTMLRLGSFSGVACAYTPKHANHSIATPLIINPSWFVNFWFANWITRSLKNTQIFKKVFLQPGCGGDGLAVRERHACAACGRDYKVLGLCVVGPPRRTQRRRHFQTHSASVREKKRKQQILCTIQCKYGGRVWTKGK